MTVTHKNTFHKGRLVIEGTEDEFQTLNTVIKEVIDKIIEEASDNLMNDTIVKHSLADLCDVGTLDMAYRIWENLQTLLHDIATYRLDDGFQEFLKWEEDYKG